MADAFVLAAFLRQRRVDLDLSQREVARHAGFAPSLLPDYENGVHEPSLSKLIAWADVLGCDVELTVRPAPLPAKYETVKEDPK